MHVSVATQVTLFLLLSFLLTLKAHAKALPTASKSLDISVFTGYSSGSADVYSRTRPTGFTFGTDVTRYFRGPIIPSLEAGASFLSSPYASERTYLFAFCADLKPLPRLSRLHPYGDVLAGRGTVHFTDPVSGYLGDHSLVFS